MKGLHVCAYSSLRSSRQAELKIRPPTPNPEPEIWDSKVELMRAHQELLESLKIRGCCGVCSQAHNLYR